MFTIGQKGGVVDVEWSASCNKRDENYNVYQSRIELKTMNDSGTSEIRTDFIDIIQGQKLGTTLNSLGFEFLKKELTEGKYKLKIIYDGGEVALQKAYVKKCNVVEYDSNGTTTVENIKTKEGGFVIYESTTDELNLNDYDYNKKNYNQYVWIPVPEERQDFLYSISEDKYMVQGLSFPTTGTSASNTVASRNKPSLILVFDKQATYLKRYFGGVVRNDILFSEQEECKETIETIKDYDGFYIGRYESGTGGKFCLIPVSRQGTVGGNQRFYDAYRSHKNAQDENVNTSLIWANQWDYMLRWMVDSSELSNYDINSSSSWGIYIDSYFHYFDSSGKEVTKPIPAKNYFISGITEYSKANNLYDLAGNLSEACLEKSNAYVVNFGGSSYYSGEQNSVSYKSVYHSSIYCNVYIGARLSLYF